MTIRFAAPLLAGVMMLAPAMPLAAQDIAADLPQGAPEAEDDQPIVVQATRSGRRVQDEPVKVEVIVREEIEEKILMRPGNIATMLAETGGLRVQVTSPALGAANIRVQGMEGRFTHLLADGLPLHGGQASSLGLLQIPPTDLGQVEVIKGAASALYGASALGGVINLVSRRPGDSPEAEVLLNATTRSGQDATAYAAAPLSASIGLSITGGYHRQVRQDIGGDGWADLPGYDRWTVRPRLFWDGNDGSSVYLTAGAMTEDRRGGTMPGDVTPDGTPFAQDQQTNRFDAGLVGETPVSDTITAHVRASATLQDHAHRFGTSTDDDRHQTLFAETSLAGDVGGTTWVGGVAVQQDRYRSRNFAAFDYTHTVPGLFAQVERDVATDLTLSGSGRVDVLNVYGTRFSPRLSALWRPGNWTIRASGGRGFFAPTPFVEEVDAAGLSRLEPLGTLKAETATSGSIDVGYKAGPLEANVTLFASNLANSTRLEDIPGSTAASDYQVRLVNVAGLTRIRGTELLLRHRFGDLVVTGSYLYLDATEPLATTGSARRTVPLTPRHSAGVVAMWEQEGKGRLGLELYYTGPQDLDDNPYRNRSRDYFDLGFLAEVALGKARLFVNAENILNVRQSRFDPVLRPQRASDGSWTVDAWAPLEGFTLNGGIRLRFGGED